MDFRLIGDEHAGHEIIFKLKQWDDAICKMDVQNIIRLCQSDVSLFDIGFELQGVQAYQELWRRYAPFFQGEIKVFRRNINIFSRDGLAFLHCYSKLDHASGVATPEIPWCRTTLCFQKTAGEWLVAHQHISVPVDFETKMSKPIYFPY